MGYEYYRLNEPPQVHIEDPISDEGGGGAKVSSRCTGCGTEAPTLDSDTTLISKRGWRLVLETDEAGCRVGAWRCPACWARHRNALRSSIRSP